MIIIENIKTGINQIRLNKGKSFLTMLGIIVGISSVIFMMTIGQSVKDFLVNELEGFGTNTIFISTNYSSTSNVELKSSDADEIRNSDLTKHISAVSPVVNMPATLVYNNESHDASLGATHPDIKEINNLELLKGRYFTEEEYNNNARVAVLYEDGVAEVFDQEEALGKTVTLNKKKFTIIGVFKKQSNLEPAAGIQVGVPLTTVNNLFNSGEDTVYFISAKVDDKKNINAMLGGIKFILNKNNNLPADDDSFMIESMDAFLDIFNNILLGVQLFLSLIAAISLVVGGIGIMNIMLVTVKERTKEIGLRKAVGAKKQHILMQFLVESMVLTLIGGIIGIIIGIILSAIVVFIVGLVKPDWNFSLSISWLGVILSCAVAILTGLVFGLYPALKAASLHPIEALRYE